LPAYRGGDEVPFDQKLDKWLTHVCDSFVWSGSKARS
jgi:hypothetical protein